MIPLSKSRPLQNYAHQRTLPQLQQLNQQGLGTILNYQVSGYRDELTLKLAQHNLVFRACTSCCDESYFGSLYFLKSLIGHSITDISRSQDVVEPFSDREDSDGLMTTRMHNYHLATDDGCEHHLRLINDSNGYYDGWLEIDLVSL